jgi:hypothetical protein
MMRMLVFTGALATVGLQAATLQEHAPVLSSTPVLQQVPVQRQACSSDGHCGLLTFHETRKVGYRVVYLYEGREYTVQLPQDPGPTITLQTDTTQLGEPGAPAPVVSTAPVYVPAPVVVTAPTVVYGSVYHPWRSPAYVYPSVGIHLRLGGGHGHHHHGHRHRHHHHRHHR